MNSRLSFVFTKTGKSSLSEESKKQVNGCIKGLKKMNFGLL